ncbi:hypothetical protein PMIT1320_01151 [Prochlorococcus marinus str. MIT 1320]|nr:hypothetical protein PMIT1320_01151 [Prochlorococcus marinus str. MIT 1320]
MKSYLYLGISKLKRLRNFAGSSASEVLMQNSMNERQCQICKQDQLNNGILILVVITSFG